jgi:hypothetical protein
MLAPRTLTPAPLIGSQDPPPSLLSTAGIPTAEQYDLIQRVYTPIGALTPPREQWFVVPVLSANNLINLSRQKWSPQALQQLAVNSLRSSVLFDHEWDEMDEAIGFLLAGEVLSAPPAQAITWSGLLAEGGDPELNTRVVAREGYHALIQMAAIYDPEAIALVQAGVASKVSIGAFVDTEDWVCPHDGLPFGESDYLPPGYVHPQAPTAEYAIRNAARDQIEFSFVVSPNLPGARVLTSDHPIAQWLFGG